MAQRIQILIVEDDPVDAELLVMALGRANLDFEWHRVDTEAAYLTRLEQKPDLIFSDCKMPRFGAVRALELMNARGVKIPFIIMSGTIEQETVDAAMRHGATACLTKGEPANLKQLVSKALGVDEAS